MESVSISSLSLKELITLVFLLGITYIAMYYVGKYFKKIYNKPTSEEDFTTQMLMPLYVPCTDNKIYKRKDKQLPWCKGWGTNGATSNLKCFVNKHLQRKCYWSC